VGQRIICAAFCRLAAASVRASNKPPLQAEQSQGCWRRWNAVPRRPPDGSSELTGMQRYAAGGDQAAMKCFFDRRTFRRQAVATQHRPDLSQSHVPAEQPNQRKDIQYPARRAGSQPAW